MAARNFLQTLATLRQRPYRIADYLREPRPIVTGGPVANRLGLQLFRAARDNGAYALRAPRVTPRVRDAHAAIERDGVVVIKNFLPPDAFDAVLRELASSERGGGPDWRRTSFGENFTAANLWATDYPDKYPAMVEHLSRNPFLLELASAVSRRPMTFFPHVDVQKVYRPDPSAPHVDLDYNQYAHTDRYYPFVKAFLYLSDVDANTAPYAYARGSHRVWTLARLKYEYAYSNRYVQARQARYDRTAAQLEADRELRKLADELLAELGLELEPIVGPANTLIVSNNQGFHRRSELKSAGSRVMAFMDFKYLESTAQALYPLLKHLYR